MSQTTDIGRITDCDKQPPPASTSATVIGGSVGGVVFLVAIIIVFIVIRKQKTRKIPPRSYREPLDTHKLSNTISFSGAQQDARKTNPIFNRDDKSRTIFNRDDRTATRFMPAPIPALELCDDDDDQALYQGM